MATVKLPTKSPRTNAERKGRMVRVTDWTYERLAEWKERSGLPMNEVLEALLRQLDVRDGAKYLRP